MTMSSLTGNEQKKKKKPFTAGVQQGGQMQTVGEMMSRTSAPESGNILKNLTSQQAGLVNRNITNQLNGDIFDQYKSGANEAMASAAQNLRANNSMQNLQNVGQGAAIAAQNQTEQDIFSTMGKHNLDLANNQNQAMTQANQQAMNLAQLSEGSRQFDANYKKNNALDWAKFGVTKDDVYGYEDEQGNKISGTFEQRDSQFDEGMREDKEADFVSYLMDASDASADWSLEGDAEAQRKAAEAGIDLSTEEGRARAESLINTATADPFEREMNNYYTSEEFKSMSEGEQEFFKNDIAPKLRDIQTFGGTPKVTANGKLALELPGVDEEITGDRAESFGNTNIQDYATYSKLDDSLLKELDTPRGQQTLKELRDNMAFWNERWPGIKNNSAKAMEFTMYYKDIEDYMNRGTKLEDLPQDAQDYISNTLGIRNSKDRKG